MVVEFLKTTMVAETTPACHKHGSLESLAVGSTVLACRLGSSGLVNTTNETTDWAGISLKSVGQLTADLVRRKEQIVSEQNVRSETVSNTLQNYVDSKGKPQDFVDVIKTGDFAKFSKKYA